MTDLPNLRTMRHELGGFTFASGQALERLALSLTTFGNPGGAPVLLLHNTTGSAATFTATPGVSAALFGPGAPLDAARHFLIAPDMIGLGASAKPSDGLAACFPNYRYVDHIAATRRLLHEALGVESLALILGLSMGGMLTWMWAGTHPRDAAAFVAVASQPGPMSGRNWLQRRISIEAIRNDPDWRGGDYGAAKPTRWVRTAPLSALMTESVARLQEMAPSREAADALYARLVERARAADANDRLYQVEASMDYDPTPLLDRIERPLLALNFADDELNPPVLGAVEAALKRVPSARYVLVPAGPATRGHFTTLEAGQWVHHLSAFLADLREGVRP